MKPEPKLYMFCFLILVTINDAVAKTGDSSGRNRTSRLKDGRREWLVVTTTATTKTPLEFPLRMVCISRKFHRSMALQVTEDCCHTTGVVCKQTEHIGQLQELNCVAENRRQFTNMKSCCRKKNKTWKKGNVKGIVDCNQRMENFTEPLETTLTSTLPPTTTSLPTTTITIPTTTSAFPTTPSTIPTTTSTIPTKTSTIPTTTSKVPTITSKPHPKPIGVHHVKTSRPQHPTNKPHHHLTTTKTVITTMKTITTTTTTTTKKPTKKSKEFPKPDVKRKVLKMKNPTK